jgi:hypothetical protein
LSWPISHFQGTHDACGWRPAQFKGTSQSQKIIPGFSDIIKKLEIGRTTFYRHFPPKLISELRQLKRKL